MEKTEIWSWAWQGRGSLNDNVTLPSRSGPCHSAHSPLARPSHQTHILQRIGECHLPYAWKEKRIRYVWLLAISTQINENKTIFYKNDTPNLNIKKISRKEYSLGPINRAFLLLHHRPPSPHFWLNPYYNPAETNSIWKFKVYLFCMLHYQTEMTFKIQLSIQSY